MIIVCRVSFGVFEQRKALLRQMVAFFNEKYGAGTVEVAPHDVYYNMLEKSRTATWISSTWPKKPCSGRRHA